MICQGTQRHGCRSLAARVPAQAPSPCFHIMLPGLPQFPSGWHAGALEAVPENALTGIVGGVLWYAQVHWWVWPDSACSPIIPSRPDTESGHSMRGRPVAESNWELRAWLDGGVKSWGPEGQPETVQGLTALRCTFRLVAQGCRRIEWQSQWLLQFWPQDCKCWEKVPPCVPRHCVQKLTACLPLTTAIMVGLLPLWPWIKRVSHIWSYGRNAWETIVPNLALLHRNLPSTLLLVDSCSKSRPRQEYSKEGFREHQSRAPLGTILGQEALPSHQYCMQDTTLRPWKGNYAALFVTVSDLSLGLLLGTHQIPRNSRYARYLVRACCWTSWRPRTGLRTIECTSRSVLSNAKHAKCSSSWRLSIVRGHQSWLQELPCRCRKRCWRELGSDEELPMHISPHWNCWFLYSNEFQMACHSTRRAP